MRRLAIALGGGALVVAAVAIAFWSPLWTHVAQSPKVASERTPAPKSSPAPAPAASAPAPTVPSFDIVKVDPGGHAVIAGRAAPGARVAVLDGDKKLGDVTADDRGEWVLVPTGPIAPGERQLSLEATDPATGTTTKSSDTVALAVAPPGPSAAAPGTVAVLLPGNSNAPAQALQTPDAGAGSLSLDTAEYNDKGELMLSGHASPGVTLRLYAANQPLGTVTADAGGKWSSVTPHPQASGEIEIRIDQLAPDGSVAQRVAQAFEPPAGAPRATQTAAAAAGRYTVQRGNSLWVIARQTYGNGLHYTVIFGANKAHIRDPNLIYPGQIITLPKS